MTKKEDLQEGLFMLGGILFVILCAFALTAPFEAVGWIKWTW